MNFWGRFIYNMVISLSTVVLNSRDWHEKMATKYYVPQNTPYTKSYTWKKPTEMHFWCYNNIALILNVTKIQILKISTLTCILSASQPAIRLTSARRMGPQKNGGSHLKHESVVPKSIYP